MTTPSMHHVEHCMHCDGSWYTGTKVQYHGMGLVVGTLVQYHGMGLVVGTLVQHHGMVLVVGALVQYHGMVLSYTITMTWYVICPILIVQYTMAWNLVEYSDWT